MSAGVIDAFGRMVLACHSHGLQQRVAKATIAEGRGILVQWQRWVGRGLDVVLVADADSAGFAIAQGGLDPMRESVAAADLCGSLGKCLDRVSASG